MRMGRAGGLLVDGTAEEHLFASAFSHDGMVPRLSTHSAGVE